MRVKDCPRTLWYAIKLLLIYLRSIKPIRIRNRNYASDKIVEKLNKKDFILLYLKLKKIAISNVKILIKKQLRAR